jgi:hypothetical protein
MLVEQSKRHLLRREKRAAAAAAATRGRASVEPSRNRTGPRAPGKASERRRDQTHTCDRSQSVNTASARYKRLYFLIDCLALLPYKMYTPDSGANFNRYCEMLYPVNRTHFQLRTPPRASFLSDGRNGRTHTPLSRLTASQAPRLGQLCDRGGRARSRSPRLTRPPAAKARSLPAVRRLVLRAAGAVPTACFCRWFAQAASPRLTSSGSACLCGIFFWLACRCDGAAAQSCLRRLGPAEEAAQTEQSERRPSAFNSVS